MKRAGTMDTSAPKKKAKTTPRHIPKEVWEKKQAELGLVGESKGPVAVHNLGGHQAVKPPPCFIQHYKPLVGEDQWDDFLEVLSQELPTTFRIASLGGLTHVIVKVLQKVFLNHPELQTLQVGDVTLQLDLPKPLDWYPFENLAWHYSVNKKGFRKTEALKSFKKFLAMEQEIGRLHRQEAVSMMPPLLIDIQSHHKVLDMCAAPGSKTGQLVELLHRGLPSDQYPEGIVIANDLDVKRCYLLTHIVQFLASPAFMVTNYNAQFYPKITLADGTPLLFDRILCDVPCSGDGTIRKAQNAANKWNFKGGMSLHPLQLGIASRGVELLKPGGYMVYSTCSMNPMENESVVSSLLTKFGPVLELIDVSKKLLTVKRNPGLQTWKVYDPTTETEVAEWSKELPPIITKTMFPSNDTEIAAKLPRCLRLYPHQQDTGGFFIAVLKKAENADSIVYKSPFEEDIVIETKSVEPTRSQQRKQRRLAREAEEKEQKIQAGEIVPTKKGGKTAGGYPIEFNEDQFIPLTDDIAQSIHSIHDFYGLKEKENSNSLNRFQNLLTRNSQATKIYLMNNFIYNLLKDHAQGKVTWDNLGEPQKMLRVINAGVRIYSNEVGNNKKLQLDCPWRITSEGINYMMPYITQRRITLNLLDFALLLATKQPLIVNEFTNQQTIDNIKSYSVGSLLLCVPPFDGEIVFPKTYKVSYRIKKEKATGVADPMEVEEYEDAVLDHPILESVIKGIDWEHLKSLCTQPFYFPAWNGKTSVMLHITNAEKDSLRNLLLSSACNYKDLDTRRALQGEGGQDD